MVICEWMCRIISMNPVRAPRGPEPNHTANDTEMRE